MEHCEPPPADRPVLAVPRPRAERGDGKHYVGTNATVTIRDGVPTTLAAPHANFHFAVLEAERVTGCWLTNVPPPGEGTVDQAGMTKQIEQSAEFFPIQPTHRVVGERRGVTVRYLVRLRADGAAVRKLDVDADAARPLFVAGTAGVPGWRATAELPDVVVREVHALAPFPEDLLEDADGDAG